MNEDMYNNIYKAFLGLQSIEIKSTETNIQNMYSSLALLKQTLLQLNGAIESNKLEGQV